MVALPGYFQPLEMIAPLAEDELCDLSFVATEWKTLPSKLTRARRTAMEIMIH